MLLGGSPLQSAELDGFEVPERLQMQEHALRLNGMGTRKATLFQVGIYVAALYLEKPSSDPNKILESEGFKQIRMKYLYEIDAADMQRGWDHYFRENCTGEDCGSLREQVDAFQALVRAVAPGDRYDYLFFPDRVEIVRNGTVQGAIPGRDFARLLLSTWIGRVPPTVELKRALLSAGPP